MGFRGRFEGYDGRSLRRDLLSGLVVGIVAIPLGMAFAIASGVKPEYGLYTVIVAGILVSLFGGSKFQIGGPTGAFVPILLAIVLQYGYEKLLIAGFLAGVILVLMGIFRLGGVIKYIPRPITIGFTAGIAVTIFAGQITNFLGLRDLPKHKAFLANMREIATHLNAISGYSFATAVIGLSSLLLCTRYLPKIPASLVGLLLATASASLFYPDQVATIGSTYGDIANRLPGLRLPDLSIDAMIPLLKPALIIALLGGIESLLSAVVADGMTGTRHNSNRELIGQGIANMVTPLFGGIPATGAIARTATNIKNGAASPLSGVIHGIVVLLVLFLFAPYASRIPLAAMAPILMVVAWNMSERREFLHILKARSAESFVMVVTFLLTVFVNLTTAVEVGLLLSAAIFIKKMSGQLVTEKVLPDPADKGEKVSAQAVGERRNCPQISIYTVEGALFFGVADLFEKSIMKEIHYEPRVLILRMSYVPYIDSTAEAYLASIVKHFRSHGGIVLVSELKEGPRQALAELIGREHFFDRTGDAIGFALTKLNPTRCLGCRHFAFRECGALSEGLASGE
ncbi:SulP family inorganic anion transporter [Cohnella sp. AR92]|uniref:SulP family inorganic anion transporter n=1 Tax=Cohnella sp. AR92 TaxID=648716 RepID=UPI000F8F0102|nr:SulP family inorganic anion transporter [Cohnella sp. AR92]RUS45091.1 STAS domain-containing protein [Cohnella sp. AR92]